MNQRGIFGAAESWRLYRESCNKQKTVDVAVLWVETLRTTSREKKKKKTCEVWREAERLLALSTLHTLTFPHSNLYGNISY